MLKKIAISQRLILNNSYYELRAGLDVKWGVLFKDLNFIPLIIPYDYDFELFASHFDIDGILLSGGNDLSVVSNRELDKKRDELESKILSFAINNNIPVFALCRGMQFIAHYFGSSLKKVQGHIGTMHKLKINEESKYAKLLSKLNEVNSYHNIAVDKLSKDFIVSAYSFDGTIKAIEHKNLNIFAVMWHSERQEPFNKFEMDLIKEHFK